ncbi:ABC transporter ATP-binding protein [Rhodovulum sulfidophilum]|uniref:ABC transporter ATP-binding protein n=1 Tax=Rhodovulum sulfidophilum TaxID=35806 RepID=UPI001389F424|nr:ABC transporter ATP-binding protein [Rhodovulum sulfidophilum]NDK36683.1 ABC transporter ATP-binding protein [Rhodovulum sulfidophilum]
MVPPLLEIRDLHLKMTTSDGPAHVLNGVGLSVARGEILGLVGESGCGKSLTGLSVSRLVPSPPAHYPSGEIRLDGQDLMTLSERRMRALRGRRIGMIFQDPGTNLNPTMRIGDQLVDAALAAGRHAPDLLGPGPARPAARALAAEMLERVGIASARQRLNAWPHEFSGGMRQRVLIAMALIGRPDLLIADEPTTALDVSVQAQILTLLRGMVADRGLGVILITHNMGVVARTCSHVAVMYAGNVVETGPVAAVLERPAHPYTRALMAAIPGRNTRRGALKGLPGTVPDLMAPPPGCRFAPRCPRAKAACRAALPATCRIGTGHEVACLDPVAEAADA